MKVNYRLSGILVMVAVMLVFSGTAFAADRIIDKDINRTMGDLEVHRGTTVNGNVSLNIGSTKIWGVVNGNVTADIGEVQIYGTVNGDVDAKMGSVTVDGDVAGNVNASTGEVTINGNVGGDVNSSLGKTRVNGRVAGDVVSGLGEVIVTGEVGGDVKSDGKTVNINGIVEGDVVLDRGIVELGRDALVMGRVLVEEGLVKEVGGAQAGDIVVNKQLTEAEIDRLFSGHMGWTFRGIPFRNGQFWRNFTGEVIPFMPFGVLGIYGRMVQKLLTMVILFALGSLIYALFPDPVARVKEAAEKNTGTVVLWGILALVLVLPLIVLLIVTIIGIMLIPVVILAFATAWILGYTGVTILLGGRILGAAKSEKENPFLKILIGVALLGVISFIPVFGFLVSLAVMIVALGASLNTRFGSTAS